MLGLFDLCSLFVLIYFGLIGMALFWCLEVVTVKDAKVAIVFEADYCLAVSVGQRCTVSDPLPWVFEAL